MVDFGIRSGGGIGDVIPKTAYKDNENTFYFKVLFNMSFYFIVILILGNIFYGIILDTFAEFRDKNNLKQDDIIKKCYICQISRDDCLKKKIDFNKHRSDDHFQWNYVYFIT
jgi:hypothetical protein